VTVREVAERLRVCRATVYRMIEDGRLPVVRVSSGTVRVLAENLLAVLAASRLE
jgi:excisionase family DNA binding protein